MMQIVHLRARLFFLWALALCLPFSAAAEPVSVGRGLRRALSDGAPQPAQYVDLNFGSGFTVARNANGYQLDLTAAGGGGGPATQIREASGPTTLTIGAIGSGQCLVRSGTSVLGQTLATIASSGSAGDLTSGTVAYARLPVGTTASTLAAGDDPRLSYYGQIQIEGVPLDPRAALNLAGSGVACSNSVGRTDCTISGYHTIGVNGTSQTLAGRLNVIPGSGIGVVGVPNGGTNSTDLTVSVSAPGSTGAVLYSSGGALAAVSAGLAGQALRLSDAGLPVWSSYGQTYQIAQVYEEWINTAGAYGWTTINAGSGSAGLNASIVDVNHPGAMLYTSGTTAGSRAGHVSAFSGFKLNAASQTIYYSAILDFVTLSNGTDRYNFVSGWADAAGAGRPANGIFFDYSDNTNGGAVACCACAATVCSCSSGGTVPTAGTWERYELTISGGVLTCQRNGATHGSTINTNFPATTQALGLMNKFEKLLGTTSISVGVDRNAAALYVSR